MFCPRRAGYEAFGLPGKAKQAMHACLRAAFKGAAFGMRGFARAHWQHGSKIVAILAHVIATVLSPIYRLLGGSRALRPGQVSSCGNLRSQIPTIGGANFTHTFGHAATRGRARRGCS